MSADQASSSARAPSVPGPKVVRYHRFVALLYVGGGLMAR